MIFANASLEFELEMSEDVYNLSTTVAYNDNADHWTEKKLRFIHESGKIDSLVWRMCRNLCTHNVDKASKEHDLLKERGRIFIFNLMKTTFFQFVSIYKESSWFPFSASNMECINAKNICWKDVHLVLYDKNFMLNEIDTKFVNNKYIFLENILKILRITECFSLWRWFVVSTRSICLLQDRFPKHSRRHNNQISCGQIVQDNSQMNNLSLK